MTTAEFAKANLAALEEPVTIRRYTKTLGTYYPDGYEPSSVPPPPALFDEEDDKARNLVRVPATTVTDLEAEVKRLKQELAARPSQELTEGVVVTINPYKPLKPSGDPFAGLAKQDRDFFERKLGTSKKKS
jgi:hypothetical protein